MLRRFDYPVAAESQVTIRSSVSLAARGATCGLVSSRTRRTGFPATFPMLGVHAEIARRVLVDCPLSLADLTATECARKDGRHVASNDVPALSHSRPVGDSAPASRGGQRLRPLIWRAWARGRDRDDRWRRRRRRGSVRPEGWQRFVLACGNDFAGEGGRLFHADQPSLISSENWRSWLGRSNGFVPGSL